VNFTDEEGGLVGSLAMTGRLKPGTLDVVSHSGMTVRDSLGAVGGDPDRLSEAQRRPDELLAYVELHIEQGGILDASRTDIGVVEGIVGIRWWDVTVTGFANHAGTTPMDQRRDALVSAAHLVLAVNEVAKSVPGRHVATVGRVRAEPGAPNVIPGRVVMSLEIRDLDAAKMQQVFDRIRERADEIASAIDSHRVRRSGRSRTRTDRRRNAGDYCADRYLARPLDAAHAERRRSRRAGHGAHRAHRHDLRAERWRNQPFAEGIHRAEGRRERSRRPAADRHRAR